MYFVENFGVFFTTKAVLMIYFWVDNKNERKDNHEKAGEKTL